MRDGNFVFVEKQALHFLVFSLPMRDGNSASSRKPTISSRFLVFL